MRLQLSVFILCFAIMQVGAEGFAQIVTLKERNVSLMSVFESIKQQTGYVFVYNTNELKNSTVNIDIENAPIEKALEESLKNLPFTFKIVENNILVRKDDSKLIVKEETVKVQQREIRGKVIDQTGDPLYGVSVRLKGTSIGTSTDNSGNYSILVPNEGATLVFSYVGFTQQEISTGNNSLVNVTLVEELSSLSEVVVMGYGEQKRKDLVGSVGSASRKDFGDVATSNSSQLIQGKIAGVQVVNSSGVPGAGVQIVVRGTGSFTNASPLYVIDGIQSDASTFNALSSYDIQDISVLKDASSVAIYGAQGANGVVIVTTRRSRNGAPMVSYNGYVGVSNPWKQFDMLNAAQYTELVKEWSENFGQAIPVRVATPEALITKTDWQKEMFRTGKVTEHYVNIGGGSEHVNYSLSVGYNKQESQVVDMDFQRATIRFNITEKIGNRIRLGQQLNINNRLTRGVTANVLNGLRMPPYISVYDETNLLGGFGIATSALDGNDTQNPLIQPKLRDVKSRSLNNYLQLFGEIDILDGLKFRSQFGGRFGFDQNYNYNPIYAGNQLVTQNGISEGYSYGMSYILENYFTYDKIFNKHNFNFTLGNSYRDGGISRSVNLVGSNFSNDEVHQIGVAKTVTFGSGSANSDARFISYFGRLNYIFNEKYIVTLTGRRDATSLFSKENRVGYFPSVGVAWRLSDEPFMQDVSFISELKLRGSWGKAGNSNIAGFSFQSNVWTGSGNSVLYPLGSDKTLNNGATVAVASTPNLKWESTTTTDVGIDATFFDHKFNVSAGYYSRINDDLLVNVPVALSTGYGGVSGAGSSQLINAASAYNKGFELSLGLNNQIQDLSYSINVNGAYNKNEVTSLGTQGAVPIVNGAFFNVPAMTRTEVGHPIGAFYGYVYDHVAIDANDIEKYNAIARAKTGNPNAVYQAGLLPGDRIFADIDGDGQVTENDQTFLGSPIPKWNYGMNLNLSYKNFDFMAAIQGVAGVDIINGMKFHMEGMNKPFNGKTTLLGRWQKPGDITDIARLGQNPGTSANLRNSSWFVENGSFARIRNVTLGYTIPESTMKPLTSSTISNVRIYLTAQNLFTFTKYTGYDPEVSGNSFIFARGIDTGAIPQPRTFMVGLQVGF